MPYDKDAFRKVLAQLLTEKDVSQYRLAKDTGIQQSTLSRILDGKNEPSFAVAVKVAEALDVSLDAFAGKKFRKK